MKLLSLCCCVLLMLTACYASFGAGVQWTPPDIPAGSMDLPRLAQPLTIDGDLGEWSSAVTIPVLTRSCVFFLPGGHKWNGPADAGMEAYCAWNADGLCIAARVADKEIINDQKQSSNYWMQDCVELFLDGRTGKEFMSTYYGKGAYQALLRPPTDDNKPVDIGINPRDGKIDGIKIASKRTDIGYNIEMLIPWSAFPGFKPEVNSLFGLQFALDDYDKQDAKLAGRLQMVLGTPGLLSQHPDLLMKCKLVDKLSDNSPFGLQIALDAPGISAGVKNLRTGVVVSSSLISRVGSLRLHWTDVNGKTILDQPLKLERLAAPWQPVAKASTEYSSKLAPSGYSILSIEVTGKDGSVLGTTSQSVFNVGDALSTALARFNAANVAKIVQTQPFKAAQYMAAAACIEKLKRGIEVENKDMTISAMREFDARMDVLETGKVANPDAGIYEFISLTADPDAQVTIEFPGETTEPDAEIQFLCGSIPFACAYIRPTLCEEEARSTVVKEPDAANEGMLADSPERITIAGLPAKVLNRSRNVISFFNIKDLDPTRMVVLADKSNKGVYAIGIDQINYARVDAALILNECVGPVRNAVEEWAKRNNVPVVGMADASAKRRVLIAGDMTKPSAAEISKEYRSIITYRITECYSRTLAAKGRYTIEVEGPTREIAEKIIELIAAGKPIKVVDADNLRREVVKSVAPKCDPAPIPSGSKLYCGDPHMHTFYSDGSPSPAGLMFEAIYCHHDFDVMTDHDTINGAKYVSELFDRFGVVHPIIIGEEITGTYHANGYPLKEAVKWDESPYKVAKAVHAQGGVIQWNHPGWPETEWANEQVKKGLHGTSFDAWEHIPLKYDEWKAAGTVPPLVGSTDTHDGTYAWGERTIIISPSTDGADIAESIRAKQNVLIDSRGKHLIYGPDDIASTVCAALADGAALKEAKAFELKKELSKSDLMGLIDASAPRVVLK